MTKQAAQLLPREKLSLLGLSALSNAELLAVIFNTGHRRETAVALAQRLIGDYGFTYFAQARDPGKLISDLGVTRLKAMQVLAVVEIGRRLFSAGESLVLVNTPAKVRTQMLNLAYKPREELWALAVNPRKQVLGSDLIAVGSVADVQASLRNVVSLVLQNRAAGVILVHNHPSGDPNPSTADVELTLQWQNLLGLLDVELVDHVIISGEKYFSFQEARLFGRAARDNSGLSAASCASG